MAKTRATTRIWVIVAITVVAVLAAATTAVAVIRLDHHDDRAHPGLVSSGDHRSRGNERGTSWVRMHGQPDDEADYLSRMVAHHREAVTAAEQLQRSDRPQMRAFGADIVKTQSAQIDQMNAWLDQWHPEEPADTDYQPMMRDLRNLSSDALDHAFLRDMTFHHMAAVMISQHLLARGLATHSEVTRLARRIRDQQHTEIHRMQRWLHSWYGESRHGGNGQSMGHGYRWMKAGHPMMGGPRWMHDSRWDNPNGRHNRDRARWNGNQNRISPWMRMR